MKFLDVKTDYAFKRVFGSQQSKPILIAFLNAILDYDQQHAIIDLDIVDPYQIPLLKGMKDSYVDVKARLANDSYVIIEMQVLNVEGFEQRVLYNAAKHYSTQLAKGENYQLLNPVIALTFTDFVLFDRPAQQHSYISHYQLLEKDQFIQYSDDIELIFIELPKFTLELDQVSDLREQWIYFVKHAGQLNYIPDGLNAPELHHAFELSNESALSPEELEIQHKRHDFIWLQKGALEKAEKDGLKKGMQKGLEKGLEQGLEKGLEQGMQQGLEQGKRQAFLILLSLQLSHKFGTQAADALNQLSLAQLENLANDFLDLQNLHDLQQWLASHS